jgi:hypothetical protein
MRTTLSFILIFCAVYFAKSQDIVLSPVGKSLCHPGVINKSPAKGLLFEYGVNPNVMLREGGNSDISANSLSKRFKIKLKAPVINREDLKVIAGWNFYGEEYRFQNLGDQSFRLFKDMDNRDLKSSSLTLSTIKPINNKFYLALKAQATFNGDYAGLINFDQDYASYNLATILGVKKNSNLEWGLGLLLRYAPNNNNNLPVLPFAFYNRTFNEKWGIEAIIPSSIKARYNINPRNIILFGPEFESRNYFINNDVVAPYTLRRSEIRLGIDYQRHLGSWFWLEVSGGYTHNLNTKFELDRTQGQYNAYDFNASGSPYFKVGLFISPSKIGRNK